MSVRKYTGDFENLLKREAEEAECMSILHTKCYEIFNKYSVMINIPVIIVSSIIGFISPLDLFVSQPILLGSLSIGIGILKTIDTYFDITKRSETHRMTCMSYIRISKWIRFQLSLQKNRRIPANDLYDLVTKDLQHLRDTEPIITPAAIREFNAQYTHMQRDVAGKPHILSDTIKEVTINNEKPVEELDVCIHIAEAEAPAEIMKKAKKPVLLPMPSSWK